MNKINPYDLEDVAKNRNVRGGTQIIKLNPMEVKFRGYDPIGKCWCVGYLLKDADIKDRWYIMNNYSDGVIVDPESIEMITLK